MHRRTNRRMVVGSGGGKCWKRLCTDTAFMSRMYCAQHANLQHTVAQDMLAFLWSSVAKTLVHGQISFHPLAVSFFQNFLQALAPFFVWCSSCLFANLPMLLEVSASFVWAHPHQWSSAFEPQLLHFSCNACLAVQHLLGIEHTNFVCM